MEKHEQCPNCGYDLTEKSDFPTFGDFDGDFELKSNTDITEKLQENMITSAAQSVLRQCDEYFIDRLVSIYPEYEMRIRSKDKEFLKRFAEQEDIVVEQTPLQNDLEEMKMSKSIVRIHCDRICDDDCYCKEWI